MSHFSVAILIKNGDNKTIGDMLAPYQENNMDDCPKEYLEFFECSQEDIDEYQIHKDKYKDLEEFMKKYHGYKWNGEKNKFGYYENPNAKWDWWEIGGRWSGRLINKLADVSVDVAEIRDVNWGLMKHRLAERAEGIWNSNPQGVERYFSGIEVNDTKESYIARESEFQTFAVITPDGKWHEKGSMGWFGISSDNEEDRDKWANSYYDTFIKKEDDDTVIYIVDCHI